MGTVIFHAGTGKAGSSSIQTWLVRDLPVLRERGIELVTARPDRTDRRHVRLVEYASGRIHSNRIVRLYEEDGADRRSLLGNLVEQLAAHAARRPVTVVTAEAAELLFWRGDDEPVDALNDLGSAHTVRVAYYVRPQHTALEAHWRQWGFRSGRPPSDVVRRRANALDYFRTYASVSGRAERFSFEPRPFRPDLLDGGDPATDFARTFLDLDPRAAPEPPPWSNRGLPIEVANALAQAPEGLFWSSPHDNDRLDRVREVLAGVEAPEGANALRARRLLHAHCRRRFEPGNERLIEALGWETDAFVPPLDDAGEAEPDLEELDELWRPTASAAELQALFAALASAIEPSSEGLAPGARPQRAEPPAGAARRDRAARARRWLRARAPR